MHKRSSILGWNKWSSIKIKECKALQIEDAKYKEIGVDLVEKEIISEKGGDLIKFLKILLNFSFNSFHQFMNLNWVFVLFLWLYFTLCSNLANILYNFSLFFLWLYLKLMFYQDFKSKKCNIFCI